MLHMKLVGIDLLVITRAAQWNNQSAHCYIIITHAQETQLTKVDVSSPEPKIQKCLGKALERSVDTVESHRDDGGGATLSIWILKLKMRFYLWIYGHQPMQAVQTINHLVVTLSLLVRAGNVSQYLPNHHRLPTAVENAFLSMIVYAFVFQYKLLQ